MTTAEGDDSEQHIQRSGSSEPLMNLPNSVSAVSKVVYTVKLLSMFLVCGQSHEQIYLQRVHCSHSTISRQAHHYTSVVTYVPRLAVLWCHYVRLYEQLNVA